jgi:hypothetical protein
VGSTFYFYLDIEETEESKSDIDIQILDDSLVEIGYLSKKLSSHQLPDMVGIDQICSYEEKDKSERNLLLELIQPLNCEIMEECDCVSILVVDDNDFNIFSL